MQLINIFFGGDLNQHVASENLHQWNGEDQWHETIAAKKSVLEKLYGTYFKVNSAHHQSIDTVGQDLEIIQASTDGVPEAIHHDHLPILGVQWHPERMCLSHQKSGAVSGTAVFRWLLNPSSVC